METRGSVSVSVRWLYQKGVQLIIYYPYSLKNMLKELTILLLAAGLLTACREEIEPNYVAETRQTLDWTPPLTVTQALVAAAAPETALG